MVFKIPYPVDRNPRNPKIGKIRSISQETKEAEKTRLLPKEKPFSADEVAKSEKSVKNQKCLKSEKIKKQSEVKPIPKFEHSRRIANSAKIEVNAQFARKAAKSARIAASAEISQNRRIDKYPHPVIRATLEVSSKVSRNSKIEKSQQLGKRAASKEDHHSSKRARRTNTPSIVSNSNINCHSKLESSCHPIRNKKIEAKNVKVESKIQPKSSTVIRKNLPTTTHSSKQKTFHGSKPSKLERKAHSKVKAVKDPKAEEIARLERKAKLIKIAQLLKPIRVERKVDSVKKKKTKSQKHCRKSKKPLKLKTDLVQAKKVDILKKLLINKKLLIAKRSDAEPVKHLQIANQAKKGKDLPITKNQKGEKKLHPPPGESGNKKHSLKTHKAKAEKKILIPSIEQLKFARKLRLPDPRMILDFDEIKQVRKYIKDRLLRNYTIFHGHETERDNIYQLIKRTAEVGESNSLLLIGPRGCGKTTMLNAIVTDLMDCQGFTQNTLMVYLDGNIHTDDRLALKSTTIQMNLENAANGKVFGSFAENLAFLLACLKAGTKKSKSVVFILEEFDLFCTHHNQTLLYNLFDVAQSAQAPICVIGVTCRLDVIELLEKRVKSRFSHRQVFLFPNSDKFDKYRDLFMRLLCISSDRESNLLMERINKIGALNSNVKSFQRIHFNPSNYKFQKKFADSWNKHINYLARLDPVKRGLQTLYDFDVSESTLKVFLYRLVSQLNAKNPAITCDKVVNLLNTYNLDSKIQILCGLSVLELCLIIAIKHHSDIYDRDPFNFEIIFNRFSKFAKVSSTMQGIERPIALKAFEHLRNIELILPISVVSSGRIQKEFEMHKVALSSGQIGAAVQKYQALPTEVAQWAQSSLI